MPKSKPGLKVPHDRFFLLGFGLFFLGVMGTFFMLYQSAQRHVSNLVDQDTLALVEFKLNRSNLEFLQTHLPTLTQGNQLFSTLDENLTWQLFEPWVGSSAALSWHPQGQFLHRFSYRRQVDAKLFIRDFLLPGEALAERESPYGTIYTPAYSASHAFMFYQGALLWADSPQTLVAQLSNPTKLKHYAPYRQLQKDLPKLELAHLYLNWAGDTSALALGSDNQALGPVLRGLGRSTPHWGLSLKIKDNALHGDAKIITDEAVYDPKQVVNKPSNRTIPDLAYLAPKNALFFQNGHDLYAKYQHTKGYLAELDPQLSLVFEGLIRAQAETWFGPNFDFETQFLQLIRGPYAFVLDFNQGLEIGFISSLSGNQDPEAINQLIQTAQSRFTPVTETVELPDGTTREELVAVDPQTVPITKTELLGQTYYSSKQEDGRINFSYTQIGEYLVMANRVKLVEQIIRTQADQSKSLAANDDFRNGVLYDFSAAEVYGFLNAPKLSQLNLYWQDTNEDQTPLLPQSLLGWRNLTFSKQVFPENIYLKLRLFFN